MSDGHGATLNLCMYEAQRPEGARTVELRRDDAARRTANLRELRRPIGFGHPCVAARRVATPPARQRAEVAREMATPSTRTPVCRVPRSRNDRTIATAPSRPWQPPRKRAHRCRDHTARSTASRDRRRSGKRRQVHPRHAPTALGRPHSRHNRRNSRRAATASAAPESVAAATMLPSDRSRNARHTTHRSPTFCIIAPSPAI